MCEGGEHVILLGERGSGRLDNLPCKIDPLSRKLNNQSHEWID
jgi:hypothetical protein